MRQHTLDEADAAVPELKPAMQEVQRTFDALTAARAKFNRCSKPASREAARVAMVAAEGAYRRASDRRDELVQVRNARMTQRGDGRGELWSRPDGTKGEALPAITRRADGAYTAGPPPDGRMVEEHLDELTAGIWLPPDARPTDYSYVSEWKISQLVAYFASSATRHHAVIVDGAMDLAVARELDRRWAALEARVEQLENHPHGCTCTRCT
jgi:hypothetical protein